MESTQRLDYSLPQEQREEPEQVGFLGICGVTYPIHIGPNRIGRDKTTCNIVLNSCSVSRHHAVINVLDRNNLMLMDLGSANGTRMSGKMIPAYISYPLKNGTFVQFGDVFGDFRLLEETDDLPMTQITDIPETPVRHASRLNLMITVPESPDVSDKEDSFIVSSQTKGPEFPNAKTFNFIKPSRTISIQPVGSSKIDNIYWNSSKKSTSLNLDDSTASLNDSIPPVKIKEKENNIVKDIHELETQMPKAEETDSINAANTQVHNPSTIHTVDTQLPTDCLDGSPSIHNLNTQLPSRIIPSIHNVNTQLPCASVSIHNLNTQLPSPFVSPSVQSLHSGPADNLPEVHKINEQQDLQFDLYLNNSIHNAETQLYPAEKENIPVNSCNKKDSNPNIKSNKLNTSNDEVLFDKADDLFEEQFESQTILPEDIDLPVNRVVELDSEPLSQIIKPISAKRNMRIASDEMELQPLSQLVMPKSAKRNMRIKSDDNTSDSTDCEDDNISLAQTVTKAVGDNDTTDDIIVDTKPVPDNDTTDDIKSDLKGKVDIQSADNVEFEDMPTQVLLDVEVIEKDAIIEKANANDLDFEDMPTQVLDVDVQENEGPIIEKIFTKEENSPFKIPLNSALKAKKKSSGTPKIKPIPFISKTLSKEEEYKYYLNTQDIFDDLCTQSIDSVPTNNNKASDNEKLSNKLILDTSIINVDKEEENDYTKNMSNQEIFEVIGANQIAPVQKVPSDESNASDVDTTPKKKKSLLNIDYPDSQEITNLVHANARRDVTEPLSESEPENNSEEQCTPIVFHKQKKGKSKTEVKLDLTKKFDFEALPSRVSTRARKPTSKLQDEENKKTNEMLKPKFIPEQESDYVKELVIENISRIKGKTDKIKNTTINNSIVDSKAVVEVNSIADGGKKVRASRKKIEATLKAEASTERSKQSIDDSKSNVRMKREPKNIKKEPLDSKNQSVNCDKSGNNSVLEPISLDLKHPKKNKTEIVSSTQSSTETKRSTRARNAKSRTKKESPPPENESQSRQSKRKNNEKVSKAKSQKEEKKELLAETEVRRSKRQRQTKEELKKEPPKPILKKSATVISEESAVYNMSSSSCESRGKRPSLDDSDAPNAKRPRSGSNKLRATPTPTLKTQYVLFTAFPFESVKYTLKNMGAEVVTDVLQSTVLLTQQIKRTFKFLCAVGLGKPIVGTDWVNACMDKNTIVDPWDHLIKDEVAEKRFHFSLERTLKGKRNFLKGYNVSSTPSVKPDANEMKLIVECSGGAWAEGGAQWVCVSVPDDRALWGELRARGALLVSTEFILGGVLRQRVEINTNMFK